MCNYVDYQGIIVKVESDLISPLNFSLRKGTIPSFKVLETELSYAFLDVNPLAKGHTVGGSTERCAFIPDALVNFAYESLADLLPVAKRVAKALDAPNYNILQNNGKLAHQVVEHVHFHIIPKPNEEEGLGVGWPGKTADKEELKALAEQISAKI
ncbi:hypothetical protein SpCBS45565_g02607 [Spizellomyces sp. 'palustris']|nr:hypothetical protein SpCBS45565_g02607 [Spizellomyces sp. 'palustris']